MILAPNLRPLSSGNKVLLLVAALVLLASCDLFKPVQTDRPARPAGDARLDEIQGRKVYDRTTGTYVIIDNAPVEPMDTVRWRDVSDNKQVIRSSAVMTATEKPVDAPSVLQSKPVEGNINTEFLSAYNVSVVLPFLSDRFAGPSGPLPPNSDWALNFYGGVKMALEDLERENVKLNVSVIDGRETSETAVMQLTRTNTDLQKAHLIIGPYRRETARILSEMAQRTGAAILSPYTTATDVAVNNPNYIQVNPSLRSHCEAITRHARQRFRPEQIVLVCRDKDQEMERLQFFQDENARLSGGQNVQSFREYTLADNAEFNNADMLSLIRLSDTTVFIVPSWANETFIYSLLRKLDLARRERTSIVVYGMPQWMNYEVIDYDYYERLNVHVSSSTYIDLLSTDVQFFRRRFFDRYGKPPGEEAFLGYDITMYGGKMLKNNGTKFQYALERAPMQMLHTRFDFERVVTPTGGRTENLPIQRFENKYVNILRFQDYHFRLAD